MTKEGGGEVILSMQPFVLFVAGQEFVLYYSTHVAMFVKVSVFIPIMHCIHNISPSTKSSEQCF